MEEGWETRGKAVLEETFNECKSYLNAPNWEWEFVKELEGVHIFRMPGPNNMPVSKAECFLEKSPEQIFQYTNNPQHTERFGPKCKEFKVLEEGSDIRLQYLQFKVKWPMENREILYVEGPKQDDIAHYLVGKSLDTNIPVEKKHTRAFMHLYAIQVKSLGDGQTQIKLIVQVDPKGHAPGIFAKSLQAGIASDLKELKKALSKL